MESKIQGIHHITAVSGAPQYNYDFYVNELGLRFIKRTINFDDPFTYHLYYGNYEATPGSSITFFPWQNAGHGSPSAGEATEVQYAIPAGSGEYWKERINKKYGTEKGIEELFGREILKFKDNVGMQISLVADKKSESIKTKGYGGVPNEHAVRGFFGVSLSLKDTRRTAELMEEFGWKWAGSEGIRSRYESDPDNNLGAVVDLLEQPGLHGKFGKGSVHHVAFRVKNDEEQQIWRDRLKQLGFDVSPVKDRQYFRSIYFREPGGVLLEIATDGPGFPKDEPLESLGQELKLPPWYEKHRKQIETKLPELNTGE